MLEVERGDLRLGFAPFEKPFPRLGRAQDRRNGVCGNPSLRSVGGAHDACGVAEHKPSLDSLAVHLPTSARCVVGRDAVSERLPDFDKEQRVARHEGLRAIPCREFCHVLDPTVGAVAMGLIGRGGEAAHHRRLDLESDLVVEKAVPVNDVLDVEEGGADGLQQLFHPPVGRALPSSMSGSTSAALRKAASPARSGGRASPALRYLRSAFGLKPDLDQPTCRVLREVGCGAFATGVSELPRTNHEPLQRRAVPVNMRCRSGSP